MHVTRDFIGCSTLKKYFCQLQFLQSRFPLGKDGELAMYYTWYVQYCEMFPIIKASLVQFFDLERFISNEIIACIGLHTFKIIII